MGVINNLNPQLQEYINIEQLLPFLKKYAVLAINERQHLELRDTTNYEKVQYLLSTLGSKSEEGQEDFIKALYESSKQEGSSGHHKMIELLQNEGIHITNILTSEE